MSRSRRKMPIVGYSTARSEADDKRLWHKRWRIRERDQLAGLGSDSDPLPVHRQEVSSTWEMVKNCKHWFHPRRQPVLAERIAAPAPS